MPKLFVVLHHHRHGVDVYPYHGEGEISNCPAFIRASGGDFEGDGDPDVSDEWAEVLGPLSVPTLQPVDFSDD